MNIYLERGALTRSPALSTTSPDLLLKTFDHYCTYSKTPDGTLLSPQLGGVWLVIFCDEVNLPAPDKYGTQHIISLLRQCIEQGGFWHPKDLSWVRLERIQFIAACNPPSDAGRSALSPRFLRHTPLLYVDFPGYISFMRVSPFTTCDRFCFDLLMAAC